ncbi:MAG: phage tail family protein [Mogibacterium sp.]|nr:phage tail family protein [Mogibacterium sp.]
MMDRSFTFNGQDMREAYGLIIESLERPVMAQLRERKQAIPYRSGAIDFGAKYRNEMPVVIHCGCPGLTRTQVRELAYALAQKGKIIFWDETDKYYIGRLYEKLDLNRAVTLHKLDLVFTCDPCAYGQQVTVDFTNQKSMQYAGTEETPCVITITNNNNYPMRGITITMREANEQIV